MSGGVAFVYDPDRLFHRDLNPEMVDLDPLEEEDQAWLREIVTRHRDETGSEVAERLLADWHTSVRAFAKVMPKDFKRVLEAARAAEEDGRDVEAAIMAAAHG